VEAVVQFIQLRNFSYPVFTLISQWDGGSVLINILPFISRVFWCVCFLVKVKGSRYRPGVAQRVGTGIALPFHDRGTRMNEWSATRPGHTLSPGNTRYPFYRRLGEPQGRSGLAENLVPTGIRSRTVQPVVRRYTDWATWPTCAIWKNNNTNTHKRQQTDKRSDDRRSHLASLVLRFLLFFYS